MPVTPANLSFSFELWEQTQKEARSLASLARTSTSLPTIAAELERIAITLFKAQNLPVFERCPDGIFQRIETKPSTNNGSAHNKFHNLDPQIVEAVVADRMPRSDLTSGENPWILVPIATSNAVWGLILCQWESSAIDNESANSITLLLQSLADAVAPRFEHQPTTSDTLSPFDQRFRQFCQQVHADPSLGPTSAIIAAEYQRVFSVDRVWVLIGNGRHWKVQAVSSVPAFQRRATVVRKLQNLIGLLARNKETFEWTVGDRTENLPPRVRNDLNQYLDESHVGRFRCQPLFRSKPADSAGVQSDAKASADLIGIVVCEWFQSTMDHFTKEQWSAGQFQAGLALQNALDWSRAPVAGLLRNWRRHRSWSTTIKGAVALVAIVIVCTILAWVPMNVTIDAEGELQPVNRRNVFAGTAGIVRSIHVSSGAEVKQGDLLLELDNRELELEIQRCEGDLLTTEKRIAAIEASRLDSGTTTSDTSSQVNSLAGELKEQRQKRENLEREFDLLSKRQDELKVTSPIAGRVVTWDVERLLSRRPVNIGQRLMTISDSSGPWELELKVSDDDSNDLFQAMKSGEQVSIEFVLVTTPESVYTTQIKSVSNTVEIRSPGDSPTLLCRADVPESIKASAVEGMSVRGRIQCGRRPIFEAAFAKFIRIVRERVLFPWGM